MKFTKLLNIIVMFMLAVICTTACTNVAFLTDIKCDSTDVKELVIESFKENNKYYKSIDESSIGSITLMYPRAVDYNKDIGVYSCAGDIIIKAVESSFSPKEFNSGNLYYNYINNFYIVMMHSADVVRYDTFTADAEYKTQISEGKLLVTSWFSNENLSCEDACKQANMRERIQKKLEREAEKQVNEHVILPD